MSLLSSLFVAGDYPLPKDIDAQSGKLSVLTERSEENLTGHFRAHNRR